MKPYIWYSRKSKTTGRNLCQELEIDGGMNSPPSDTDFLICWGMSNGDISHLNLGSQNVCILNHPKNSQNAVNKLESLKLLHKNDVNVAPFQSLQSIKENGMKLSFPLIGRKLVHQGGWGLFYCKKYIERAVRKGCEYFSQFIPSDTEYRVHIFLNKVVRISEKVPSDEEPLTNNKIRNHRFGWRFAWRPFHSEDYPIEIIKESFKAIRALKLDFGAVDVLWGKNNKPYILEVNTAPALDGSGLNLYAEKIQSFIKRIG